MPPGSMVTGSSGVTCDRGGGVSGIAKSLDAGIHEFNERALEVRFGAHEMLAAGSEPRTLRGDAFALRRDHPSHFGELRSADAFAAEDHVFGADGFGEIGCGQRQLLFRLLLVKP